MVRYKMKILFISSSLPPHSESQSIRNLYLIKALMEEGHTLVGVSISSSNPDDSLWSIVENEFPIILVEYGWFKKLSFWIETLNVNILTRIINILGPLLIFPDLNVGWSKKILRNKKINDELNDTDLIISSSGSYEAHLASFQLNKRKNIPMLVEMGDPWAFNPIWPENFWFKKFFNRRLEKKIISSAIAVTFTTKETKDFYENRYLIDKFHYVPMGFSENDFDLDPTNKPLDTSSVVNFVYVGVAFRASRDITPFLDCLYKLDSRNLKASFYGSVSQSFETYVKEKKYDFVSFFGTVPYKRSIEIISDADVLIILGNDSDLQIPGKTYMYLASGKPIIYLASQDLKSDPTWNLIKSFKGVYGFDPELRGLDDLLSEINYDYEKFLDDSKSRLSDPFLKEFLWEKIGHSFIKIIESEYESHRNNC